MTNDGVLIRSMASVTTNAGPRPTADNEEGETVGAATGSPVLRAGQRAGVSAPAVVWAARWVRWPDFRPAVPQAGIAN